MPTEKLYYENTYQKTFSAKVLECAQKEGHYAVVLNRTAFYPEGGGQPADIGVLNTVNVLDVHERGGVILHTTDRPFPVGAVVTGGIHWPHRFALMQQHSGEHIVSGIVHRLFGYDNVGFHMGAKAVTVDFNGELDENQLALVETLANEAVAKDIPVTAECPPPEKLHAMEYRSKKELTGEVRIVTVPGYDVCACCGTHVARTGEIGIVRLASAQRYKGGTRVTLLFGWQALQDYREKSRSVNEISVLLSAKQEAVAQAAERLLAVNEAEHQELARLRQEMFTMKAQAVPEGTKSVCLFEPDLAPNDLRRFCLLLCERCKSAAIFSGSDEAGYKYAFGSAVGDVRPLGKEMNRLLSGRGGGSKELIQGSLKGKREEIERFWAERVSR